MESKDGKSTIEGVETPPAAETPKQPDTITVDNFIIPHTDIVETMLQNIDVVRFGEEDWTFSVALAAIQGGWRGIVSTSQYVHDLNVTSDAQLQEWLDKDFAEAKQKCEECCKENGRKLGKEDVEIENNIRSIKSVEKPIRQKWLYGISPTETDLTVEGKVAWYQCPWEGKKGSDTALHIKNFLKHMGKKQRPGDYVLIGITNFFPYVKSYNLGCLPGFTNNGVSSMCPEYDLVGADKKFIDKLLQFGYHHKGRSDIHEKISYDHLTLIFKRKGLITLP